MAEEKFFIEAAPVAVRVKEGDDGKYEMSIVASAKDGTQHQVTLSDDATAQTIGRLLVLLERAAGAANA